MTGKFLGKITSAEFGKISDYPMFVGLKLYFHLSDGSSIGDGGTNTVNISKEYRWEESERTEAITTMVEKVNRILEDAKVYDVSQLVGKPVEVTIESNTYKNFRILTEVL